MVFVVDWSTTAALLAIILAEGVRRLPAGSVVLRRATLGGWRIVHGPTPRQSWHLVSAWAPLSEHLVVQTAGAGVLVPPGENMRGASCRGLPSRLTIAGLRVAGLLVLLLVAFGIPTATATFGVAGLVRSLLGVLLLSCVIALLTAASLRRSAGGWMPALARTKALASPFTAPRASELLHQEIVKVLTPRDALGSLVRRDDFDRWYRVHAYDALEVSRAGSGRQAASEELERIIGRAPPDCGPDERFCPRCAAVFRPEVTHCSDCASVPLRTGAARLA